VFFWEKGWGPPSFLGGGEYPSGAGTRIPLPEMVIKAVHFQQGGGMNSPTKGFRRKGPLFVLGREKVKRVFYHD